MKDKDHRKHASGGREPRDRKRPRPKRKPAPRSKPGSALEKAKEWLAAILANSKPATVKGVADG